MAVIAGDWQEIRWTHPTLGSGVLFPKAGEDFTVDTGGYRGDDDANMVDAGGRNIKKLTQTKWSVEGPVSWDMDLSDELTKLSDLAASAVDAEWTFTHISGVVWGGTGSPVGDQQGNSGAGTIDFKVNGGGRLKKLS